MTYVRLNTARLIHLSDGGPEHSRETDRGGNNRSSVRSVHLSSRRQVIPLIFIYCFAYPRGRLAYTQNSVTPQCFVIRDIQRTELQGRCALPKLCPQGELTSFLQRHPECHSSYISILGHPILLHVHPLRFTLQVETKHLRF